VNKKALSLAICAALAFPTITGALSLGEIESNSHLNQPFKGKINLLYTNVAEAKKLRVRIAPAAVFNRVGIDRPAFLNSIRFRTTVQNGKPVILVTSNQPINEPFINFLLEISWPNGQLLKEYTVLLDPPVLMTPNTAIASNTAGVRSEPRARANNQAELDNQKLYRDAQRALQQPRRVVRATQGQRSSVQRAASSRRAGSQVNTYLVRRGDTLSKISKKLGYRGISRDQMMLALFEKNRKAFFKSNMNNLKSGVVLQRPSLAHAKSVSRSEAKKARITQARAWKQTRTTAVAKTTGASKGAVKTTQARIEVAGKADATAAKSAALAASGKASVNELRKQLVMTSEALQSREKHNEELKSRVSEMESLLRKKNRLISMKSQQLAKLQATISGKAVKTEGSDIEAVVKGQTEGKGAGTIVRPKVEGTSVKATEKGTNDNLATAAEEKAQAAILATQKKIEAAKQAKQALAEETRLVKQQAAKKAAAAKSNAESGGLMDGAMGLLDSPDALKYGAGGGAALALLGGFWFMRRRNAYKEFSAEDYYAETDTDDLFNDESNAFESDVVSEDITTGDELDIEQETFTQAVDQDADQEKNETGNQEEDLLQEADVYIVYGLYDQAESELKEAINKSPKNLAYRKKLLESYKASGDKAAFEKEAKIFKELDVDGKDEHWDDICEWGNALVPDSNLFEGSSAVVATAAGVAMMAGTAVAQTDNEVDLDDLISSDESIAEEEFENIDLDAILSEDMVQDDLSGDSLVDDIDALDLTAEPEQGDFEIGDLNANELSMDVDTGFNSLDSLLDDVIEDTTDTDVSSMNLDTEEVGDLLSVDSTSQSTVADASKDDNLLADFDDNLSFLDLDDNEVIEETQIGTKIDLAKAYIDMGDIEGARSTLEEVMEDGTDEQKLEAEELLHHTG